MKVNDYHVSITVDTSAQEAFKKINEVTKWWTENLGGNSQKRRKTNAGKEMIQPKFK